MLAGQPVSRPNQAPGLAATGAPFLIGGWTHFIGISCPSSGPPPGPSLSPEALHAVDLLAPGCRSQLTIGETFTDQGLFWNLAIPAGIELPWQGAVVVRMHSHDAQAAFCPDSVRVTCEAALVVDAVLWRLDSVAPPTEAPTPSTVKPFVLRIDGVDHRIGSVGDCARLDPTSWFGQFCSLLLRPDWRSIVVDGSDGLHDPFWAAATARAQMDGDLSICSDVRTREWGVPPVTGGSGLHPVAGCQHQIADPATPGVVVVNDPTEYPKKPKLVEVRYPQRKIAVPPAPAADPFVRCPFGGPAYIGASACGRIVEAVLATPAMDPRSVASITVTADLVPCADPAACVAPSGARLLGSVAISFEDASRRVMNAWDVGGVATLRDAGSEGSPSP